MRKLVVGLWLVFGITGALVSGAVNGQDATPEVTPSVEATAPVEAAPELEAFIVEGIERTYALHVPTDISAPAPLVIVLHGRFGTGVGMEEYSQFDRVADDEGFIVVYPDGINNEWNYVEGIPGYPDAQNDVFFIHALIDHLAEDYAIDPARIYLTGFSNGGFMTQRMACQNPARFAGFASVSAAGFGGMAEVCTADPTITAPMLMIHGTADDNIPWIGRTVTRGGRDIYITYPVAQTFGFWADVNRCATEADTIDIPESGHSPGTNVRVLTLHCPAGTAVALYGIVGGGHNWARPDQEFIPVLGVINRDIDTAREIWRFFEPLSRTVTPDESP